MVTEWTLPDPMHVLDCIEKWRGLDLKKMNDSEIDSELESLLESLHTYPTAGVKKTFPKLWRIRKCKNPNSLYLDVQDFWEPLPEYAPMSRCNSKGDPVLYVSEKVTTPFEELTVGIGDYYYLIKYGRKADSGSISLSRIVSDQLCPKIILNGNIPLYTGSHLISYRIIREFIRSEFLKPVSQETNYLYRISGALCRVWFNDDKDGWYYPSVHLKREHNIALKKEAAHEKLEIEEIKLVKRIPFDTVMQSGLVSDSSLGMYQKISLILMSEYKGCVQGSSVHWSSHEEISGHL